MAKRGRLKPLSFQGKAQSHRTAVALGKVSCSSQAGHNARKWQGAGGVPDLI